MSTTKEKKIQISQYDEYFSNQIDNADNLRDESLQRLHKIRLSRQKSQQRQLNKLVLKFDKNDSIVLRQADRIIREKEFVNYIGFVIDKKAIDTDPIKDSYILRGKVRGDSTKGLSGYTVQLMDTKKNVVGKSVKTDVNGNYSLIVDFKEGDESRKLNVVVLDKQGAEIHKDILPISLKTDVVDIRDIVIASIDKIERNDEFVIKEALKIKKSSIRKKRTVAKKVNSKTSVNKRSIKKTK